VIVLLSVEVRRLVRGHHLRRARRYIGFTVSVTEWRSHFRRAMNEQDSKANTKAIDALLNYETVKYFSNERFEQERYDDNLRRLEKASVKSQASLSLLNLGQSFIIAIAVTLAGVAWRRSAWWPGP
jgi:ATP-binding cassette subfamily B protein